MPLAGGISLITIICLTILTKCASCLSEPNTNRLPYKSTYFFAGRTVYENYRGTLIPPLLYTNCQPVRFWTLQRHATRSPDELELKLIKDLLRLKALVAKNHAEGRGYLTPANLRRISEWTFSNTTKANILLDAGWNETKRLARRLKMMFPAFNLTGTREDQYFFRHTDTQRTRRTAQAFIDGLFKTGAHKKVKTYASPRDKDTLLYPFAGSCPALGNRLNNISTYDDENKFLQSDVYNKVVRRISKRLGFTKPLSHDTINAVYLSCAHDIAEDQEYAILGAWCPAMTILDILVIEYFWDLHFFTIAGYQNDLNKYIGCGLVKDLWRRFFAGTRKSRSSYNRIVTGHFTHDGLLLFFHRALGLAKDKVLLTSDNFYRLFLARKWRSSFLVPFTSNISAVLYKCTNHSNNIYRVQFLRNERPMPFKNCPNGMCSWKAFEATLKPIVNICNPKMYCNAREKD